VAIEIADNGVGGAEPAGGSGLRGLRDRVDALAGMLVVTSPVGEGTVITAELPCSAVTEDARSERPGQLLSARPAPST
jgi:glucose-6-phosphate-specific signal transduction histidine kinase